MLCSNCSAPVNPVIAVDIDGTLGDYYGHILEFAKGYFGRDVAFGMPSYDGGRSHGAWYEDAFEITRAEFRDMKLAFRQGSIKRTMPPYEDRIWALTQVKEAYGIEIWLTTTRPYLRLDNVDPDTRWWLEKHSVPFDYLLYDDDKYQELALRVEQERVIAVIDNELEQLEEAERVFGRGVPILATDWHNEGISWEGSYLTTGNGLFASIGERMKLWHDEYVHNPAS